jgi:Ni2+-binding GTPase involved in maturation of urease and hydrogenase
MAESEEIISQNIFILGAPRSGKTMLLNKLLDRNTRYEPLRAEAALIAVGCLKFKHYDMPKNRNVRFFKNYFKS